MRPEQKEAARAALIAAAGRRFRLEGMEGVGIDALAKEAGQTSGAVYAHFASKAEVFRGVVREGLRRLLDGVGQAKAAGPGWLGGFVGRYLSAHHRAAVAEGCLMPALSADVGRADDPTRADYAAGLEEVVAAMAEGLEGPAPERRARAIALLALSAGGLMIARAVPDGLLAGEILDACRVSAAPLLDEGVSRSATSAGPRS